MRILFITRKWPPAVGGMETYSVELTAELRKANSVDIHALPGGSAGAAPGGLRIAWFGLVTACRVLFGHNDHDVIHGGDMAIWPLVALARVRSRNVRTVLSAHGTDVSYAFRSGVLARLYAVYMKTGARLCGVGAVLANSQATADLALSLGFNSVAVIPLATRASGRTPVRNPGRSILFAGRLVRRKGLAWFVENVLPRLPADIELEVAGTIWDDEEEAALYAPRVMFLGALPQDELHVKMAEALCVVMPNIPVGRGHMEGFGLIAVEAAASGAVVVAADLDGFRSSVIDGVTGRLLPPENPDAWIEAIHEIAAWTPDHRQEVAETAQKAAGEHFSWPRVAEQTIEEYQDSARMNS